MSDICSTFASSFVYVYATYTNERTLKYAINYLGCPLILRGLDRVIYGFPDNSPSSAKQRNWEFNYDPPFSAKGKNRGIQNLYFFLYIDYCNANQ